MKVKVLQLGFIPADQEAAVELQSSDGLLLRFINPFESDGEQIEYAVAVKRHETASIADLKSGKQLLCKRKAATSSTLVRRLADVFKTELIQRSDVLPGLYRGRTSAGSELWQLPTRLRTQRKVSGRRAGIRLLKKTL